MDTVRLTIEIPADYTSTLTGFLRALKITVDNVAVVGGGPVDVGAALPQSAQEVIDYCKENDLIADGKKFYDFYTKRKWMTSTGKVIDDWKQLLRKWDEGDRKNGKKPKKVPDKNIPVHDDLDHLIHLIGVDE